MESRKLKRVVIREEFFALTNDTFESIILGQLLYWQERLGDFDKFILEEKERREKNGRDIDFKLTRGWMYKSAKDLADECMLKVSEVTIRRYINHLIDKNFVECRHNPDDKWDKTLQYRVNLDYIITELKKLGYNGLSGYKHQNELSKLQNEASELQNEAAIPIDYNKDYNRKETISLNNKDIEKKYSENFPNEQSLQFAFAAEPSPLKAEEQEKEKKNSAKRKEKEDADAVKDYYNSKVELLPCTLPKILKMTDERVRAVTARILEYGIKTVYKVIDKAVVSDFLNGRIGDSTFRASFDWIMKPRNFPKIYEGNYDNIEKNKPQPQREKKRDAGSVYHDYAGYGTERYRGFIKWLSDNATYIYEHYTYLITLNQFTEMVKVGGTAERMSEIILELAANPTEYVKYDNLYEFVKERLDGQR